MAAKAAESGRGPAYVELLPLGVVVVENGGGYELELHGGYHFSGRHDGFVAGLTQKLAMGAGFATLARVGYDFAVPIGRRELTIAPYGFAGAIYNDKDAGAYFGGGGEVRLFPILKRIEASPTDNAPKQELVEVAADHIEIRQKIQFRLNEAVIESVSFDLLDEIAKVIKRNPQLTLISIEGHASSEGDPGANAALSASRARAVRDYLVGRGGVAASVLEAKGFGAKRPIAPNDTTEGREKNRRVEFNIAKQSATVQKLELQKEGRGAEGLFFVLRPLEIGVAAGKAAVVAVSIQGGVGYAF